MKLLILAAGCACAGFWFGQDGKIAHPGTQEAFALAELVEQSKQTQRAYLPFLDRSTLSCGLYRLPAGSTDGQSPHELDEVYYLIEGEATFRAGEEERKVGPGDVLFVAAGVEHRFHTIEKDLSILVFFSNKRVPSASKDD